MEFRILGPVDVVENGRSLALGGAQQRALLALLVLHRGEAVATDRLVDQLWGERPPATAAKTVQVYVSQLRKTLGNDAIVTRGRGYALAVEAQDVDVGRFEALVADGRRALADGDAARASERLGAALALWRGQPLDDFAYEHFAQQAIAGLEEARLAAHEDRIDADLALGRAAELIPELERLIASQPLRERLRGQLMIALYRVGRQAEALAVYRRTSELLRDELGLEPSRALQELERSILEQNGSLDGGPLRAAAPADLVGVCPFKGLGFFDQADAEFFCGRERLVSELVARLAESALIGILGPSGIGKSSLLRAGVLPALSAGALPGSARWRQVLVRPGKHPSAELARATGSEALTGVLDRLGPGERVVLAIDQLEELFTVCEDEHERAAFLEQLATAASDRGRRALVLVSLRADFYGRLAHYRLFARLLGDSHVLVGPMDRAELTRAIEQPAARAGLEVERPLVDALVSDVAGEPGGLPLLSTALLELWRARDGRTLRYESYRTSGGVHGAVARLAEQAYARLSEPERRVARSVMLRLAGGDGGELTRRRVPIAELERLDGAEPVLATLTDARLLTVSNGEVELSHEALLREWPRYRAWLDEDRVGRRLQAHLTPAAHEWSARGRDPGDLYRGARLAAALDWAAQHGDQLNAVERDFIQSSRLEADRAARRQRSQNRRLRTLLLAAGVLLVVAVVAGAFALVKQQSASNAADTAATAARVALGRQLGAVAVNQPRTDLAMLLAREAVNLDRSPQTERTLLATLLRSPAVIGTFALPVSAPPQELVLSPDDRTLAVSDRDSDLHFYDVRTHELRRQSLTGIAGVEAPVYSSDGSQLVYPMQDDPPRVAVRDVRTLELLRTLAIDPVLGSDHTVETWQASVAVAPDGRTIYCAYRVLGTDQEPGAAYLGRWSLPSGRRLSTTRIGSRRPLAVRLVDAGARLVIVDTRNISVFDTTDLGRSSSVTIARTAGTGSAAAISPDGGIIAIGSRAGVVSFVDPATGNARLGIGGRHTSVTHVAYSPDGRRVVTTGDDKVIVWDPKTARRTEVLTDPGGQVQGAALSADGTTLYTSSLDRALLSWDLAGERRFGRRVRLGAGLPCCGPVSPLAPPLALSPDGSSFAARIGASTVGIFSTRTLRRKTSFTVTPKGTRITALAWSPAGPELAVAGYSGVMQLWRVDGTPRPAHRLVGLQPLLGFPEAIQAVAFSPDGRLVAATDNSETRQAFGSGSSPEHLNAHLPNLAIWRTSTGTLAAPPRNIGLGPSGCCDVLAFSRDGNRLAVSLLDGRVLVLQPSTGKIRHTLRPLGADLTIALAFAPDGTLAAGTVGGVVRFRDPTSGDQVGPPAVAAAGPVTSIAFDRTGRLFATAGGRDGAVKLWFASTVQQEGISLNTERGGWASVGFAPDGKNLFVVNDRGSGFSWPTSLQGWGQRACAIAGRNLSRAEWSRFVPGRSYTRVCG